MAKRQSLSFSLEMSPIEIVGVTGDWTATEDEGVLVKFDGRKACSLILKDRDQAIQEFMFKIQDLYAEAESDKRGGNSVVESLNRKYNKKILPNGYEMYTFSDGEVYKSRLMVGREDLNKWLVEQMNKLIQAISNSKNSKDDFESLLKGLRLDSFKTWEEYFSAVGNEFNLDVKKLNENNLPDFPLLRKGVLFYQGKEVANVNSKSEKGHR